MTIQVTREDVMALIKGTGGPGAYVHPFNHVGGLVGYPNERWQWNESALDKMSVSELYALYKELRQFQDQSH